MAGRPKSPPHSPQPMATSCQKRGWEPVWPRKPLWLHSCDSSQVISDSVLSNWPEMGSTPHTAQAVSTHTHVGDMSLVYVTPLGKAPVPQH